MKTFTFAQTLYQLGSDDIEPAYPEIIVNLGDLRGPNGNAWFIAGAVKKALKDAGLHEAAKYYGSQVFSGTYADVLELTGNTVTALVTGLIDNSDEEEDMEIDD